MDLHRQVSDLSTATTELTEDSSSTTTRTGFSRKVDSYEGDCRFHPHKPTAPSDGEAISPARPVSLRVQQHQRSLTRHTRHISKAAELSARQCRTLSWLIYRQPSSSVVKDSSSNRADVELPEVRHNKQPACGCGDL